MNNPQKLKKLLEQPGITVAPGVFDCIGAKIVEKLGFETFYMTGNGSVASKIGVPDIGIATRTEMVEWAGNLSRCVNIPLICDADNGYGDLNNVHHTVRRFEEAGLAAIHIEDQGFPKKCGAMQGVNVLPAEEAAEKIKVAVKTRKDMLIIARSDCMSVYHSTDEMVRRLNLFADAGADLVYPEMVESYEQLKEIVRRVNAPVVYDILEANDFIPTIRELEHAGVKFAFNCLSIMLLYADMATDFFADFKEHGDTRRYLDRMMQLHQYEKLMGLEEAESIRKLLKD